MNKLKFKTITDYEINKYLDYRNLDINLENLALNESSVNKKINKKTAAIFLTHAMGFNGLSQNFLIYLSAQLSQQHQRYGANLSNYSYELQSIYFC